jgi:DNA ligase (NAD+)
MKVKNVTPEKVAKLVDLLTKARNAYYNGPSPLMTDARYDQMEDALRAIDPNHSFFQTIGASLDEVDGWKKVKHNIPMMSLNKAQSPADLKAWWEKCFMPRPSQGDVLVTEKLDGLSVAIRYEDGELVRAVTRGDGEIGVDITRNVKLMNVPKTIKIQKNCDVRGEVVCKKSVHAKHFPNDSNPRNTASGTAQRQSDPSGCKHLDVIAFQLIPDDDVFPSKAGKLQTLKSMGFETPNPQEFHSLDAVEDYYDEYVSHTRDSLDYDIDGLVVEVADLNLAFSLGELNHKPKGAIAFKFPHDCKESALRDILWQVGNTGRITPVAVFDEVELAGAKVTRASLHNVSNIEGIVKGCAAWQQIISSTVPGSLDARPILYVGDVIVVSRRNDVIPYVESLLTPQVSPGSTALEIPTVCPDCGAELTRDGEYLMCYNTEFCTSQKVGAVKRWIKKLGVLDWGGSSIEAIFHAGMVADPADLYTLDANKVAALNMGGRRIGGSASNMLNNLHAKKDLPINVFVGSLGIPLCSRSVCKMIADAGYDTLEAMGNATEQEIASIPKLGTTKAKAFVTGFKTKIGLISKLLTNGVTIKAAATGALVGKSFCMTGFRDAAMAQAIEDKGGIVKSSVTKNLDFLVLKDPSSTSGKARKARAQGTKLLSIADAQAMVK